jgi:hypothetical protein
MSLSKTVCEPLEGIVALTTSKAVSIGTVTNSIGVNTHLDFSGNVGYQTLGATAAAINYLGVKNLRDSADNPNTVGPNGTWQQIASATGAKFDDYMTEGSTASDIRDLGYAKLLGAQGILNFVEGGNENDDAFAIAQGNSITWTATFQQQVYAAGHAMGLPVINMSFGAGWTWTNDWHGDYDQVGDLSLYADYANAHTYPLVTQLPDATIQRLNVDATLAAVSRPVITTEIGWNNSNFSPADAARFTLDAVFDGIKDGNVKTYFYAIFDDSAGKFGLMNADGSAKPAGAALHNLTTIMADTGAARTDSLTYELSGTTVNDKSLLTEKSDGTFQLAIWNETDIPHNVALALGTAAQTVRIFDPLTGTSAVQTFSNTSSVTVSVVDHPVVVEVAAPPPPVVPPPSPNPPPPVVPPPSPDPPPPVVPPPSPNPLPPAGTTADMILRDAGGNYEIYDIGNNAVLSGYALGRVGTDYRNLGFGNFNGSDTSDMMLRSATSGAFEVYNISNNNIIAAASLGTVGSDWSFAGFGDFNHDGTTDMMLRNATSGSFEAYSINNNQITSASNIGAVGLDWQAAGFGDFNGDGTSDMMLRNASSGTFEAYDIHNGQLTTAHNLGAVGLDWQVAGFGNFQGPGTGTDMMLRNATTGTFELYDIRNNAITGATAIGAVGLDWHVAGFGDFNGDGTTDMMLRNAGTGAFEAYDIQNGQLASAHSMGAVGLDWKIGGFSTEATAAGQSQSLQLAQAMSSFAAGSGAPMTAAPLASADSPQSFLATPQHAGS